MEASAPTTSSPGHSLLWSAVQANALELERMLARAFQAVAALGLLIALIVTAWVDRDIGLITGAIAIWCLVWFTAAVGAMGRGIFLRWYQWANPVVEVTLPALVLVALARSAGPDYALASWVPPQLFAVFIAGSILRLRKLQPLLTGLVAAAAYGVVYFVVIGPTMADDGSLLHEPPMQAVRMVTLVVMGAGASLAVVGLHTIVERAGRDVRSQDLFGKYRLGRLIAEGGMGQVVEAVYCPEGGFKRRVAVKIIHPHLATDPLFLGSFRHEAELCSRLLHPNIVGALDFGSVDDTWFFAMEYVDGPTLNEVLKLRRQLQDPLAPGTVLHIALEIAAGLHFAAAQARDDHGNLLRVVHCDLSPTNVLLDRSGRVRISDFGVARALGDTAESTVTTLAGKPGYMAPEQLEHHRFDERADLWALGVMLWEMLVNERLFAREDTSGTMQAVLEEEVRPPSTAGYGVGPHWDGPVMDLLRRDPEARTRSAADLLQQLRALQEDVGVGTSDDIARLVSATEDVPVLDLDSTEDVQRSAVADIGAG